MMLRVLDMFSGIGAFSLGLDRAGGFKTVAFVEIDPFCRAVLAKHWPDVPCHDDVTTRKFVEGEADVICGGFPCPDLSYAGLGAGIAGARSGLYRELVRAFRVVRPKFMLLENVSALLGRGMGKVLGDLAESRTCGWVEWDCVRASDVGAPHERDRIWIVAHSDCERWGEAWELRHRQEQVPSWGIEARTASANAPDSPSQQMGPSGQPRFDGGVESGFAADAAYTTRKHGRAGAAGKDGQEIGDRDSAEGIGCRQGWARRPPDSFARIRDEARRNAADPYGARLAFREGLTRDAWEKLTPAERDAFGNVEQSIWPDEPALQGVDDGTAHWLDRTKATGNALLPQIPELIGRAIMEAMR